MNNFFILVDGGKNQMNKKRQPRQLSPLFLFTTYKDCLLKIISSYLISLQNGLFNALPPLANLIFSIILGYIADWTLAKGYLSKPMISKVCKEFYKLFPFSLFWHSLRKNFRTFLLLNFLCEISIWKLTELITKKGTGTVNENSREIIHKLFKCSF